MADIQLVDLKDYNTTGAELFNDSESFITDISDESDQIVGGICWGDTCDCTGCVCLGKSPLASWADVQY